MEYIDIATKERIMSSNNVIIAENMKKIYDAGKKSQYDEFWDTFQAYGKLEKYNSAFSHCRFNKETFKPKYPLRIIVGEFTFAYQRKAHNTHFIGEPIHDLIQVCKDNNIMIDTSKATELNSMFYASDFTTIPTISFESQSGAIRGVFYANSQLETIEKIIFKADGSNTFTTNSWELPFGGCSALKNLVIEGVIGDSFNISSSPLTKESITSVVNALSSTSSGKTVSFSKSAKTNAFSDSEWSTLIATKSNWTFSLV